MDIKISIVIPTYKTQERWLRRIIDIILAQTLTEWELIIVNDGPDENIKNIVFSYSNIVKVVQESENETSESDSKIRYIQTEQHYGFAGHGRNIGLKKARGEYIFFHDHDDSLYSVNGAKYALEEMYSEIIGENEKYDVLIFNPIKLIDYNMEKLRDIDKFHFEKLIKENKGPIPYSIWDKLIKVSFLKEHDFCFNENFRVTDIEFCIKIVYYPNALIKIIDKSFYVWRFTSKSLSVNLDKTIYKDMKMVESIKNICENYNILDAILDDLKYLFASLLLRTIQKAILACDDVENAKAYVKKYFDMLSYTKEDCTKEVLGRKRSNAIKWLYDWE
jgi:CDP-glycerol glycerophosphotransferase